MPKPNWWGRVKAWRRSRDFFAQGGKYYTGTFTASRITPVKLFEMYP